MCRYILKVQALNINAVNDLMGDCSISVLEVRKESDIIDSEKHKHLIKENDRLNELAEKLIAKSNKYRVDASKQQEVLQDQSSMIERLAEENKLLKSQLEESAICCNAKSNKCKCNGNCVCGKMKTKNPQITKAFMSVIEKELAEKKDDASLHFEKG